MPWFSWAVAPVEFGWEADLWGRVRRQTEGAQARATATADDLESARLSVQAELAVHYFMLRSLTAEAALEANAIQNYRRSLELIQNRRRGGIVSDLDVSQANAQLRAAEAALPVLERRRQNLVHALATLCGQAPIGFQVADAGVQTNALPEVALSLPSELLERRPDIAAAERRMNAANADIGVARSAFYPRLHFNGLAGFQSVSASTWLDWPSRIWAIGPSVDLPLFTGGRNRAKLAVARATYDATVAEYRETVLSAFQEVEDQLAAQHWLTAELEAQSAAYAAARRTLEIATNRYQAGLANYLEVTTAQTAALARERAIVQLRGQRLVALIELVKSLGGGWLAD